MRHSDVIRIGLETRHLYLFKNLSGQEKTTCLKFGLESANEVQKTKKTLFP
jgi:hypothetical protein